MTSVKSRKPDTSLLANADCGQPCVDTYPQGHLYGESSWSADFQAYLNDDWGIGYPLLVLVEKVRAQRGR